MTEGFKEEVGSEQRLKEGRDNGPGRGGGRGSVSCGGRGWFGKGEHCSPGGPGSWATLGGSTWS